MATYGGLWKQHVLGSIMQADKECNPTHPVIAYYSYEHATRRAAELSYLISCLESDSSIQTDTTKYQMLVDAKWEASILSFVLPVWMEFADMDYSQAGDLMSKALHNMGSPYCEDLTSVPTDEAGIVAAKYKLLQSNQLSRSIVVARLLGTIVGDTRGPWYHCYQLLDNAWHLTLLNKLLA